MINFYFLFIKEDLILVSVKSIEENSLTEDELADLTSIIPVKIQAIVKLSGRIKKLDDFYSQAIKRFCSKKRKIDDVDDL